MTKITVKSENNRIVSVECSGHTGYAMEGEDIVCAALSSVVQTAVLGVMAVVGIDVEYTVNEDEGYLRMTLPKALPENKAHDAEVILSTMVLGVRDLYESYSDYIELEVL